MNSFIHCPLDIPEGQRLISAISVQICCHQRTFSLTLHLPNTGHHPALSSDLTPLLPLRVPLKHNIVVRLQHIQSLFLPVVKQKILNRARSYHSIDGQKILGQERLCHQLQLAIVGKLISYPNIVSQHFQTMLPGMRFKVRTHITAPQSP